MGMGPGGLDCDEVLADVFIYLDNETAEDARDRIREHLESCPHACASSAWSRI